MLAEVAAPVEMVVMQRAFEIRTDAQGFYVAWTEERLIASCSLESEVDAQIGSLKEALDSLAARMKKLIREERLSDPFALPAP